MKLTQPASLAATLDAINESFFSGKRLSRPARERAAKWIASRQGMPRSYAGMFAPTELDFRDGIRVFTGEPVRTGAATAHILGEEACRALILLNVRDARVRRALASATDGMLRRLPGERRAGMYCCGICSVSLWRHLAVGGLDQPEKRLADALRALKARRLGDGRWRPFPFWYTLLALTEIGLPAAVEEMRYAAPICERLERRRTAGGDEFAQRRRVVAERVLARS